MNRRNLLRSFLAGVATVTCEWSPLALRRKAEVIDEDQHFLSYGIIVDNDSLEELHSGGFIIPQHVMEDLFEIFKSQAALARPMSAPAPPEP